MLQNILLPSSRNWKIFNVTVGNNRIKDISYLLWLISGGPLDSPSGFSWGSSLKSKYNLAVEIFVSLVVFYFEETYEIFFVYPLNIVFD